MHKHANTSRVRKAADAFCAAMRRMCVRHSVVWSRNRTSAYIHITDHNGRKIAEVRISNHPRGYCNDLEHIDSRVRVIDIGLQQWANYWLEGWFMCLGEIAELTGCAEAKRMAPHIIAEEKVKWKGMPQTVVNTILAREAKRRRKQEEWDRIREERRLEREKRRLKRKAPTQPSSCSDDADAAATA